MISNPRKNGRGKGNNLVICHGNSNDLIVNVNRSLSLALVVGLFASAAVMFGVAIHTSTTSRIERQIGKAIEQDLHLQAEAARLATNLQELAKGYEEEQSAQMTGVAYSLRRFAERQQVHREGLSSLQSLRRTIHLVSKVMAFVFAGLATFITAYQARKAVRQQWQERLRSGGNASQN